MNPQSNNQIDIVYPLGSGSRWSNNEIRYSIRSVEKHVKGYRNIIIVGSKPSWLNGIIHVKSEDPLRHNADGNIALKVLKVCELKELSETFLFINDDHIFLRDIHILDIPDFYKGNLDKKPESFFTGGLYKQRLKRTLDILKERNLPTKHFDCHTPILINKDLFPGIIRKFPFQESIGFTMKSLYANSLKKEGVYRLDLNIKTHLSLTAIEKVTEGHVIMAFNDGGLNGDLKKFLKDKFPLKSKFEIMDTKRRIAFSEAIQWLESPSQEFTKQRYDEGKRIYCELGRNRHLLGLVKRAKSESLMRAIERDLKVIVGKETKNGTKPIDLKELNAQKEAARSAKQGKAKINTNPYVDPNALPEQLRDEFEENNKRISAIAGMKTKLEAIEEGEEHNDERKDLAEKIIDMEKQRDEVWKKIDAWWKDNQNGDKLKNITKASGTYTRDEILKIEDTRMATMCEDLRIKANKRYISRYENSTKPKQVAEVKLRRKELEAWGVKD